MSNGQIVNICVPQNNWNELFIVGVVETNADTIDRSFDKTYKGIIIEADNKNQEYVVSINGTQRKLKSDFFYYVGSEVTVRAIQGDFSNLYLEMNKDNDIYIAQMAADIIIDAFKRMNEDANRKNHYDHWAYFMIPKFMEYKGITDEDECLSYTIIHFEEWESYLQEHLAEFEAYYEKYKDITDPMDFPQTLE